VCLELFEAVFVEEPGSMPPHLAQDCGCVGPEQSMRTGSMCRCMNATAGKPRRQSQDRTVGLNSSAPGRRTTSRQRRIRTTWSSPIKESASTLAVEQKAQLLDLMGVCVSITREDQVRVRMTG
jgi:hypothetical protein